MAPEADIVIYWNDNLKCRISADPGIAFEIYEEFSFIVPGAKFQPLVRAGRWDGRIRLFDIKQKQFYVGLLPRLVKWADSVGYSIKVADKEKFKAADIYDEALLQDVIKASKFEPKWYQLAATKECLKRGKVLVLSPTASGKSYIIYMLVRFILENTEDNVILVVPTKSLVEQMFTDFEEYAADGWKVEGFVDKLYGDIKNKNPNKRCLITTWQSVFKKDKEFFERYNTFICDEAHSADAKSISSIVDKLRHADRRFGFTGTLDGSVMHETDMLARFGSLFSAASTRDLMDAGDVAKLLVDCHVLKYPKEDAKLVRGADYQDEINFLVSHKERNKFLAASALACKGNTIMLFNYIEKHGRPL